MGSHRTASTGVSKVNKPDWWAPSWETGSEDDPDHLTTGTLAMGDTRAWHETEAPIQLDDEVILAPLEAKFGQVRSKERVRDLAEVFTHQREVDAILDQVPDAFGAIDIKFLEPACGSGNFLVEILLRKLRLVPKHDCASQDHYEHRLLRSLASIYGVDISPENITEARARMAHSLLSHYQSDANTIEPTLGFLHAAALILGDNIVVGDTLNAADQIELCDWQVRPGGCFLRVWTYALVPQAERGLFWYERVEDSEPIHFSEMTKSKPEAANAARRKKGAAT